METAIETIVNEKIAKLERRFVVSLQERDRTWASEKNALVDQIGKLKIRTADLSKRVSSSNLSVEFTKISEAYISKLDRRMDLLDLICGCDTSIHPFVLEPDYQAQSAPPQCEILERIQYLYDRIGNISGEIGKQLNQSSLVSTLQNRKSVPKARVAIGKQRLVSPYAATTKISKVNPTPPLESKTLPNSRQPELLRLNRIVKQVKAQLHEVQDEVLVLSNEEKKIVQDLVSLTKEQKQKIFTLEDNMSQIMEESNDHIDNELNAENTLITEKVDALNNLLKQIESFQIVKVNEIQIEFDHKIQLMNRKIEENNKKIHSQFDSHSKNLTKLAESNATVVNTTTKVTAIESRMTHIELTIKAQNKSIVDVGKAIGDEFIHRLEDVEVQMKTLNESSSSQFTLLKQISPGTRNGHMIPLSVHITSLPEDHPRHVEVEIQRKEFQEMTHKLSSLQTSLQLLRKRNEEIEFLQTSKMKLEFENTELKSSLEVLMNEKDNLELQLKAIQISMENVESKRHDLFISTQQEELKLKTRIYELEEMKNQFEIDKVSIESRSQSDMNHMCEQLLAVEKSLSSTRIAHEDAIKASTKHNDELQHRLIQTDVIRTNLEKEKSEIQRQLESHIHTITTKQTQITSLESLLNIRETAINEYESDKQKIINEQNILQLQLHNIQEQFTKLNNENQLLSTNISDTKLKYESNQRSSDKAHKLEKNQLLEQIEKLKTDISTYERDSVNLSKVLEEERFRQHKVLNEVKSTSKSKSKVLASQNADMSSDMKNENEQKELLSGEEDEEDKAVEGRNCTEQQSQSQSQHSGNRTTPMIDDKSNDNDNGHECDRSRDYERGTSSTASPTTTTRGTKAAAETETYALAVNRGIDGMVSPPSTLRMHSTSAALSSTSAALSSTTKQPGPGRHQLYIEEKDDSTDYYMDEFLLTAATATAGGTRGLVSPITAATSTPAPALPHLPSTLSELQDLYHSEHLRYRRLEQWKSKAKLIIKDWILEYEAEHGTPPTASDKREIMDKYVIHYEV
eukprot:gene3370-6670_t